MYLCLFADKTHSEGFSASFTRLTDKVVPTFGINTYNKHTKEKDIIKLLFSSRQLLMWKWIYLSSEYFISSNLSILPISLHDLQDTPDKPLLLTEKGILLLKWETRIPRKAVSWLSLYHHLLYDIAVIQWITLCHKDRMTTCVIPLWPEWAMSLTTFMSTVHFLNEIMSF